MTQPIAWITHAACVLHEMGPGHPESPHRLRAIAERLAASGLDAHLAHHDAPLATREQLGRAHSAEHVERILSTEVRDGWVRLDPDTAMNRHSVQAALRAAGAAVHAVDLVLDDRARLAFCAVRPPGHHAEHDAAMGFCIFNNVAVAAAHALSRGLSRVAILDFDVHYGNGTADIVQHDPRMLLCSTYQHPLYPFWAGLPGVPNLIDDPLPPFAGSAEYREAVEQHWLPTLRQFRPELILVSAGFDAHARDPLANLKLETADFAWSGEVIRDFAQEFCGGRVVATLEGGYDLAALAESVEAFLQPFAVAA